MSLDLSKVKPFPLIVMGVSGTGKSTVAEALAQRLGWEFQEGDSLHPINNVEKMRAGFPLTDEDRIPWLRKCREWLRGQVNKGRGAVLTCSSLKLSYRERLSCGLPVYFIYLKVSYDVVAERLSKRAGHFMPPSLLKSQFRTLEEPVARERVIVVDADHKSAKEVVDAVLEELVALSTKDDKSE